MKQKSARAKEKRMINYLIPILREELDKGSYPTLGSGNGLDKNDIRIPDFNIEIEAKNHKRIKLIEFWEQTKRQTFGDKNKGVLMVRNPKEKEFDEILCVMSLDDWIDLVKNSKSKVQVENNLSPNLKWKVKALKEAANNVFKELTKNN